MRNRISAVIGGVGLFLVVFGVSRAAAAFNVDGALVWFSLAAVGAIAFLWSLSYRKPQTPADGGN